MTVPADVPSLILLSTLLVCFAVPLIYSIIYCIKQRWYDRYRPLSGTGPSEKNQGRRGRGRRLPTNKKTIDQLLDGLPADFELIDPFELRQNEVYVDRRNQCDTEEKNEEGGSKDGHKGSDDSFRLNIKASDFQAILSELGYNPIKLMCLNADERDPSKSLIQNWFEYCQPNFEIPDKLTTLCANNASVDRSPKHRVWDNTAYLVDKKHFIKASAVPLPGNSDGIMIVCQAPIDDKEPGKKETRGMFWKMVQEQKCEMIVMACRHKEKGAVACGKYFPEELKIGEIYGDFKVTVVESREMYEGELIVRRMEYYDKKSKVISPSCLLHYQFTNWEEGKAPKGSMAIEAVKFVVQQARRQSRPVIVHSSIGTGRAAVLAGIEFLSWSLSVFKNVTTHFFQIEFRTKLMGGIQNGEQLLFTQNVALDMIMKSLGCTEYEEEMKKQWDYLKNYYELGPRNAKDLNELGAVEVEKFGQKVGFTAPPGFKRIVVVKAEDHKSARVKAKDGKDELQKQLAEVRKKKEGGANKETKTTTIVDELEKDKNKSTSNTKADENEKTTKTVAPKVDENEKTTKTADPLRTTTAGDPTKTETTTMGKPPPDEPKTVPIEAPKEDDGVEKMDLDAEEK